MVQVQHRPSTRVTPQQRKRPQTHKNYDGKGPRKTPNMRLHAAHTEVCERLCMQGPCRPPCRETAADTMGAASGARGSWLRCGREQKTATAASDGQPVHLARGNARNAERRLQPAGSCGAQRIRADTLSGYLDTSERSCCTSPRRGQEGTSPMYSMVQFTRGKRVNYVVMTLKKNHT